MQARAIADPTSWRYLAAIHGFDAVLWRAFDYLTPSEPLPSASDQDQYWQQCQHQSWYFFPWHRGYIAAIEAILRAAIVALGGPSDWAVPYWNYNDTSNPNARTLPSAFQAPTLPDGTPNPLTVTRRYGDGTGAIVITPVDIDLRVALTARRFTGATSGGSTGFGGPQTLFSHAGSANGQLENRPHNGVHVLVGGRNPGPPRNLGLMSHPNTAGLDPVFWIHHANIDRLWEVWLRRNATHRNPSEEVWLQGPANRAFAMPAPDGTGYTFAAADVLDTEAPNLDYVYEDVSDPLSGATRLALRLERLALPSAAAASIARAEERMDRPQATELIGANDSTVRLQGAAVETQVRVDRVAGQKVMRSFQTSATLSATPVEPDRIFLNLENIRGRNDAAIFYVYVNLPQDANPEEHPDRLAGVVSLFGVQNATRTDDAHAGNGINEVLEITEIVDALHSSGTVDLDHLSVRFVPRTDVRPEDDISVGRVSVYREGQ